MSEERGRLPGDLLRRVAEAVLSRRIVEQIVIPVLADLQHEAARSADASRWRRALVYARGYAAFWSALALCLVTWPARSLREDWLGADAPGPRLLGAFAPRAGVVGLASTLILMLQWPTYWANRKSDPLIAVAALPSVLAITIPIALLLGLVLAVRRLDARQEGLAARHCLGAVLGVSALSALLNFALVGWVLPQANQSVRERLYAHRPLPKGNRELTLGELRAAIREGRLRGEHTVPFEVEWHKKLSLPAVSLVFGPLAVGLVSAWRRRSAVLPVAYAVTALFVWYLLLRLGQQAALAGRVTPVLALWAGDVLFGAVALRLLIRSSPPAEVGRASVP